MSQGYLRNILLLWHVSIRLIMKAQQKRDSNAGVGTRKYQLLAKQMHEYQH
jgi:hypothetical protein